VRFKSENCLTFPPILTKQNGFLSVSHCGHPYFTRLFQRILGSTTRALQDTKARCSGNAKLRKLQRT